MLTTNSLLNRIMHGKNFQKVLETNDDCFTEQSVSRYLKDLCEVRRQVPEQVIKRSQIDRTYGHQIFNGTRIPSRDKLIQLAFGFGLTFEETQTLLKKAGKCMLYAKVKRDAACIYGLSHKMSVMEVQDLMASLELPLLGEG